MHRRSTQLSPGHRLRRKEAGKLLLALFFEFRLHIRCCTRHATTPFLLQHLLQKDDGGKLRGSCCLPDAFCTHSSQVHTSSSGKLPAGICSAGGIVRAP